MGAINIAYIVVKRNENENGLESIHSIGKIMIVIENLYIIKSKLMVDNIRGSFVKFLTNFIYNNSGTLGFFFFVLG